MLTDSVYPGYEAVYTGIREWFGVSSDGEAEPRKRTVSPEISIRALESIMVEQMSWFLFIKRVIVKEQYGFAKDLPTLTHTASDGDWIKTMDAGDLKDTVYLEFPKTFDTLPKRRLLHF